MNKINKYKKRTISQKVSDRKHDLCMPKKKKKKKKLKRRRASWHQKRNSQPLFSLHYTEQTLFLAREESSHQEIAVDL